MMLPFIVEIRCLLDWVFSKTSLDIFQFWQLFNYHVEMFLSWTGNKYYTIKALGIPIECLDKCIFGVLIASVILFLLIGPFYLFSTISPYVDYNPISQAYINMNFQVNKTIWINPSTSNIVRKEIELKNILANKKLNDTDK